MSKPAVHRREWSQIFGNVPCLWNSLFKLGWFCLLHSVHVSWCYRLHQGWVGFSSQLLQLGLCCSGVPYKPSIWFPSGRLSALLEEPEAGERMTRIGSTGLSFLGEKQHDLGLVDLFLRSWSRDPVAFYKGFGQTVMIVLEENLLNTVKIHIMNKRSLLYALYAPYKVYSINNYMLFCFPKNEMTGILNTISVISCESWYTLSTKFKEPFSSNCF